jgi:hypothetical protein
MQALIEGWLECCDPGRRKLKKKKRGIAGLAVCASGLAV